MTTITTWVSYDERAPSGAYIASDSLITYGHATWETGKKTFHSLRHPELFAYSGDVLFPSLVLGQHVAQLDSGAVYAIDSPVDVRIAALSASVANALASYPPGLMADSSTTIIHVARDGMAMEATFVTSLLTIEKGALTNVQTAPSLDAAGVLEFTPSDVHSANVPVTSGSGATAVMGSLAQWRAEDRQFLSRRVFEAHCHALSSGRAAHSGGDPQLVGLYRVGPGRVFGFAQAGRDPSLAGAPLPSEGVEDEPPFRNHLFERVDRTGLLLPGAKSHADEAADPIVLPGYPELGDG